MSTFRTALAAAQAYRRFSYARNTRQAYASDWRLFSAWCAAHQRRALPATPETVLGYVGAQAGRLRVATIDRRLRGVAFVHRQARQPDPTSDPEVRGVLRGLRRRLGTAPGGKAPLTIAQLQALVATCDASYRGVQERAILLLGFAGAFRRSELVALQVADLSIVAEGLIVRLRRSKTDQEGQGSARGVPFGRHPELCPVRAVQAWLAHPGAPRQGALFRAIDSRGNPARGPLPAYAVSRLIQRRLRALGLPPAAYGGHSLRAGFVTAAAQAGVPEYQIMRQTGHADVRTVRRYIRDGSLFRDNAMSALDL